MAVAKIKTTGSAQFALLPAGFLPGVREVEIVRAGRDVVLRLPAVKKGAYRKGRKRLGEGPRFAPSD